jgi:NAD-dependent SIR2 family protein deacetylase
MARGKHSKFICDRCGWKFPFLTACLEEGTQLRVCTECYDGMWDRVLHPQNHPPRDLSDDLALPWSRNDTTED